MQKTKSTITHNPLPKPSSDASLSKPMNMNQQGKEEHRIKQNKYFKQKKLIQAQETEIPRRQKPFL